MHHARHCSNVCQLFTIALTLALAAVTAHACAWDRDTLGIEARGLPGVAEIITGRFERNPPLYYEMRLARVTAELKTSPGILEHYDDAGVACDRLGRGDEAIAWMAAKKKQLDALGESDPKHHDHLYRYHANLGTFHAHRWIRNGKNREQLDDMKLGRDLIAKAIEINPDAHFGREKYQLAAMEWIISMPVQDPNMPARGHTFLTSEQLNSEDSIQGLTGLIALGNAWQSVDVFHALMLSLQRRQHGFLAEVAKARLDELIDAGARSLHPSMPTEVEAMKQKTRPFMSGVGEGGRTEILEYYKRARAAADQWHKDRESFMLARLSQGRHPDTDPTFWDGYVETAPEPVPGSGLAASAWSKFLGYQGGVLAFFVIACASLILFKFISDRIRRNRALRNTASQQH